MGLLSEAFAVKQWKVALSLAILAAIAAPFVTHTVRMRPTTETWIPLTQDEKERISAELSKTSNCRTLSEQFDAKKSMSNKPSVEDFMDVISRDSICRDQLKSLELGGYVESHPSILKYAAFNLASALAGLRYRIRRSDGYSFSSSTLLAAAQYIDVRCPDLPRVL